MARITDEMKDMILERRPALIATADASGMPNVSPRFIIDVPSESTLLYGDNFANKSFDNLRQNPRVAVLVADYEEYRGFQFKGTVTHHTEGPYYEAVRRAFQAAGWGEHPVQAVVVHVEEIYSIRPDASSRSRIG